MRRIVTLGAVLAALLLPTASSAQVSLGLRLGYAWGLGDVGGGGGDKLKMSDWVDGQVPIQVDALFRVTPDLAVGPYFSYGFARAGGDLKSTCDVSGVDCSAYVMRLGVEGIYTLPRAGTLAPWLGLGIGYEWNRLKAEGGGENLTMKWKGVEWLNLQAGMDFFVAPQLRTGPFLMLSLGRYDKGDASGVISGGGSINDKKFHEWLQVGWRGQFDL
ncbi:LigA [Anaeromyxobacter sp. K]|uniref:autotransporter domain-containing protein n=1 Tax=Anaeromyxobacter sp. (strain K) TaxID=447217 RepID=UPI00015F8CB5|nr:autotransporter domain-containing protein [Anaeromyxobacter sp. K]ACG75048.1 LigA [Anaeromyxobacter sp. K]